MAELGLGRRPARSRRSRPGPTSGSAGCRPSRWCTNPASGGSTTPAPTCSACSWPGRPGSPSTSFLRERVFEPLGMVDTGFATSAADRLGTCYHPATGTVLRPARRPVGEAARLPLRRRRPGLDLDDFDAFAAMLLAGGRCATVPGCSRAPSVEAMTIDHLGVDRGARAVARRRPRLGVRRRGAGPAHGRGPHRRQLRVGRRARVVVGQRPSERLVGIILTTDMFAGPVPPPAVIQDFWNGLYAAMDD